MTVSGRTQTLTSLLLGALCCAASTAAFFPGYVSPDSIAQLTEARTLTFVGIHPPAMSLLWALTDRVVPGPGGLFVLHQLAFWGGLTVLAALSRRWWAGLLVLGTGLTPSALALTSTVWKDIGLAAILLLAFGLIVLSRHTGRRAFAVAGLPLLFYGAAVRHNAVFAIPPLAFLWCSAVAPRASARAAWAGAAGLVVALALGAYCLDKAVVLENAPYPAQQIYLHDLAGISVQTQQVVLPRYLRGGATPERLRASYAAWAAYPLFIPPLQLRMTADAGEYSELRRLWRRNVRAHWLAYLTHRWDVFALSVGIGPLYSPFHPSPHAGVGEATLRQFGIAYAPSRLRDWLMRVFEACRGGPWFRAWVWLALAGLVLTAGAGTGRASAPTLALAASATCYGLPYFFVGVACDFRFQFWTYVGAAVSAVMLAADVAARRGSSASQCSPS